ncbi:unnamed protein product [Gordionus sp. m RMFG-2023]
MAALIFILTLVTSGLLNPIVYISGLLKMEVYMEQYNNQANSFIDSIVLPLVKETCYVLLLKTPKELMSDLKGISLKIDRMDHIISYKYPHVWRQSSSVYVVSIRIMIHSNSPASYQHYLSSQVSALFADAIMACLGQSVQVSTTVQVEKEIFHKHLSGICSKGYSNTDLMLNHNDPSSPLMIDFYEY